MNLYTDLNAIIGSLQEKGIVSEEDVRSKFILPLLKWLGYPDEVRAEAFPVYSFAGSKKIATKEADYILFSERGYEFHKDSKLDDVDWVRDHTLLVVEAKRPGQMPTADLQPEFYSTWTKTPAYILTDSIHIRGRFGNDFASGNKLLDCNVRELTGQKALQCFSYERLCAFKKENLEPKEYVEMIAADMAFRSDMKEYAAVDHYIPRRVQRIADIAASVDSGTAVGEELSRLWDACRIDRHVILIGEAGTGKSNELQQLAHIVSTQDKPLTPIVFFLKNYNGENIEDIVKEATGYVYCANSILIMDAFDEIPEQQTQVFLQDLNRYVEKHPKQYIVLSTRFSFYRCADGLGYEGPLKQFKGYTLLPLSREDIEFYLQMEGINDQTFFEEVDRCHLSDIIAIPFYLYHIAHLYLDEGRLPAAENLMEKLVMHSFRWDDQKYAVAFNNDLGRANAYDVLKKIAFIMQCIMKNDLIEEDYGILLTSDERRILRYCSLWSQDAQHNYHFEHNNFREFLAAQALHELSAERQVSLLTDGKRIKPSWLNTTSYLLRLDPEGVISRWIREHNLFDVIHMEPDKLSTQVREDIFTELWNKCKEDSIILVKNNPIVKGLTRFGQTKKCIHFLCDELSHLSDERCRRNALRILQGMDDYLEFRNVIRKLLKKFVMCNADEATSAEAINTLGVDSLYDTEDLGWMLGIEYVHTSFTLRGRVYNYVYKHQLQGCCTDFILEGLDLIKSRRQHYDLDLVIKLGTLIKRFRSYEELHAFLEWYVRNIDNLVNTYATAFTECMRAVLKNASVLYREGCSDIADDLITVHLFSIMHFQQTISEYTRGTLAETDLLYNAYEKLLSEYNEHPFFAYMLKATMDQECLGDLLNRYLSKTDETGDRNEGGNNTLITDDVLLRLAHAYGAHTKEYMQIKDAILEKTGSFPTPALTWEQRDNLDKQSYFDALFDREEFINKLAALLQMYRGEETTFSDINTHIESIIHLEDPKGYLSMWYMLKQYGENRGSNKITAFFEIIKWEVFAISQVYSSLWSNRGLELGQAQLAYIRVYTDNVFSTLDIDKEISCKKDGSISYSPRVAWACFFAARFDYAYDAPLYRRLLLVPGYFFGTPGTEKGNISSYLLKHLNPADLYQSIVNLCDTGKAIGTIAIQFIRYAREQGWPDLESLADAIIRDEEYRYYEKNECILYLLMFNSPGDILHSYMEEADDEFRTSLLPICLTDTLKESERVWLRNILEKIWMESEKKTEYLRYLISLNSECGLDEYCRLAKEQNGIPDYTGDDSVLELTEAIEQITDVNLLDKLLYLAELAHKEGFKDRDAFGLRSSIGQVLLTMGEEYPKLVISKLDYLQRSCSPEKPLAYYCRYYIESIQLSDLRKKDVPISMWEAKRIYECRHMG